MTFSVLTEARNIGSVQDFAHVAEVDATINERTGRMRW